MVCSTWKKITIAYILYHGMNLLWPCSFQIHNATTFQQQWSFTYWQCITYCNCTNLISMPLTSVDQFFKKLFSLYVLLSTLFFIFFGPLTHQSFGEFLHRLYHEYNTKKKRFFLHFHLHRYFHKTIPCSFWIFCVVMAFVLKKKY